MGTPKTAANGVATMATIMDTNERDPHGAVVITTRKGYINAHIRGKAASSSRECRTMATTMQPQWQSTASTQKLQPQQEFTSTKREKPPGADAISPVVNTPGNTYVFLQTNIQKLAGDCHGAQLFG